MSERLHGPDLDTFEIGAGGEKRALPTPAQEQAAFEAEISADRARRDAIIDEYMGDAPSNNQRTHESSAEEEAERFRMEKAAYKLLSEFPDAVTRRLSVHGFKVRGLLPNGNGNGYVLYTHDAEGRPFNVELGTEDTTRAFAEYGESMGVGLVTMVEERVLAARKRYFERMGPVSGPSRLVTL